MEGLGAVGDRHVLLGDLGHVIALKLLTYMHHLTIDDRNGGIRIPEDSRKRQSTHLTYGTAREGIAAPGEEHGTLVLALALWQWLLSDERHA